MIALTRITSKTVISKGFRLRGQALEPIDGGKMYSGTAERLEISYLRDLSQIIEGLTTRQAITFGGVKLPGDCHSIVTKPRQSDGNNIARARKFFAFLGGKQGILLLDYDPPKDGSPPLSITDVMAALHAVCPALAECETLISASASSFIYKNDGTEMRGSRGWHIFVRVANAADIPVIGDAIAGRCWLAGFGRLDPSKSGGKNLRNLIDEKVWKPEQMSFDGGAACGSGLVQKRPTPIHADGRALTLADVALSDQECERVEVLKAAARGTTPPDPSKPRKAKPPRIASDKASPTTAAIIAPIAPGKAARIMQALLHVPSGCDYQTWIQIGMGLKTSCGESGFPIWNHWSKTADNYPGEQSLRAKWATFDSRAVTLGTVYHHAKLYGWSPKKPRIALPLPIRDLPVERHDPLAEAVSINAARDVTLKKLYAEIVKNDAPAQLSAMRITVGTGKTSNLKTVFEDAKRAKRNLLIVARDRTQCASYEEAGAFWRHGREATEQGFTPATPWHCPHAGGEGPVAQLAASEHRLQQMCKGGHCEHGNRAMLDQAEITGREPSENVIRFFKEFPEKRSTPACMWFDHMSASQRQQVRVVTAAGLSPADLKTGTGGNVDQIVVDESVEWSHSHMLDLPTIRGYIESLQAAKNRITKDDEGAPVDWLEAPMAIFHDLSIKLGLCAADSPAGVYTPVTFDLPGIVTALNGALDDHGSALWEKPQWQRWTELVKAPLRALSAIKDGIAAGSLTMIDGALHVTYLHSVVENAVKKNIPIMIMDATLDATAAALVPGDQVTHVVAEPNCEWVIDPRRFVSAQKDEASLIKESVEVHKTWRAQEEQTGYKSYVITRMRLALFMLAQHCDMTVDELREMSRLELWDLSIKCRIGWFGWHDVAHDKWNGLDGLIWGQHPVPDATRIKQYMDHRALLMQVRPDLPPLPIADGEWAGDQWISTGVNEQKSQARLPVQPEVRAWLLQKVAAQKIQAAGRSRAVCQENRKVTIWQVGGYPMVGLAEHGIRARYERLTDGFSGAEVAVLQKHRRFDLMTRAAAGVVAAGGKIMRETVRDFCKSLIGLRSSGQISVRDRYIYIYQPRTLNPGLDANKNNNLPEPFVENEGVWNDEYAEWRAQAPAHLSARFARIAEMPVEVPAIVTETATDPGMQIAERVCRAIGDDVDAPEAVVTWTEIMKTAYARLTDESEKRSVLAVIRKIWECDSVKSTALFDAECELYEWLNAVEQSVKNGDFNELAEAQG